MLNENFSNLSYYDLAKRTEDEWSRFDSLLSIHDYLAGHRFTEYSLQLRARIELRLRQLVQEVWNEMYALEILESSLEESKDPRMVELLHEVSAKVDALYDEYESFKWPSTAAVPRTESEVENYRERVSLISLLGYKTGLSAVRNGVTARKRREILSTAYELGIDNTIEKRLPRAEEWGLPRTSLRLKKIAYCSAESTKDMKRNTGRDYCEAIEQREADLAWLKATFYNGVYDWEFPSTSIEQ